MQEVLGEGFGNADAERFRGGLQANAYASYGTVVVRPLNVNGAIKTAFELGKVIGYVRHEVGVVTVLLAHHSILVVLEVLECFIGGAQPQCTVGFVGEAGLHHGVNGLLHTAVGVQRAFEIEVVEGNAELLEVGVLFVAQISHRVAADAFKISRIARALDRFAGGGDDGLLSAVVAGDVNDVVAVVAVFREIFGGLFAGQFFGAGLHGNREIVNLNAGVVVVELAHHAVALRGHDAGEHVAQSPLTSVPQMQRAGGVGRDVLEKHALAFKSFASAVSGTLAQHVANGTHLGFL